MIDKPALITRLDETLTGLEANIKKKNNSAVNSNALQFTELLGDNPGMLSEQEITKYGFRFRMIMKDGGYMQLSK